MMVITEQWGEEKERRGEEEKARKTEGQTDRQTDRQRDRGTEGGYSRDFTVLNEKQKE
jgi:hypothetical protein